MDVSLNECGGYYHHGCARSVSWNSTGNWLAMGGPSPRIWSVERAPAAGAGTNSPVRCSEVLVISGHNAETDRVLFHPNEPNNLCTSAMDGTVRVWDIRAGTERAVGRLNVQSGKSAAYIDWCSSSGGAGGVSSSVIAVTERDGSVHVYDARKLASGANLNRGGRSTSTTGQGKPLHTFRVPNADMDACIFSPNGNHLVAASCARGEMVSDLRIWSWGAGSDAFLKSIEEKTQFTVAAHTGPVFSLAFSGDGKRLATGSSDSIVGIWDVATMCCTATITKRLKLIRGVAYSCDSKWLANCNEEDGIDVANATTGEVVGSVPLRENSGMGPTGGGDEVAFSPTNPHLLACARIPSGSSNQSAAVVIKCRISQSGTSAATGSER